jgi:hypothetical protein
MIGAGAAVAASSSMPKTSREAVRLKRVRPIGRGGEALRQVLRRLGDEFQVIDPAQKEKQFRTFVQPRARPAERGRHVLAQVRPIRAGAVQISSLRAAASERGRFSSALTHSPNSSQPRLIVEQRSGARFTIKRHSCITLLLHYFLQGRLEIKRREAQQLLIGHFPQERRSRIAAAAEPFLRQPFLFLDERVDLLLRRAPRQANLCASALRFCPMRNAQSGGLILRRQVPPAVEVNARGPACVDAGRIYHHRGGTRSTKRRPAGERAISTDIGPHATRAKKNPGGLSPAGVDISGDFLLSHNLEMHYHRGCGVSLPCSEWVRVGPPR